MPISRRRDQRIRAQELGERDSRALPTPLSAPSSWSKGSAGYKLRAPTVAPGRHELDTDGPDGARRGARGGPDKVHISFDVDARKEYLTGFAKRKAERRKRGHAFEALKRHKAKRELTRERREERGRKVEAALGESAAAWAARAAASRAGEAPRVLETVEYRDSALVEQWGDVVTVETTLGVAAPDDDEPLFGGAAPPEPPAPRPHKRARA